jgi:DNA-binding response OmpR family regulator
MKLLMVEDDDAVARVVSEVLSREGYALTRARSCAEARRLFPPTDVDGMIMDVGLPDGTGLELLGELRRSGSRVPVLMLTSLGELDDVVRGLDAGADDYLTKPFEIGILTARVRALVRRAIAAREVFRIGPLEIDRLARKVSAEGKRVRLTPKEYALLEYFLLNRGRPISRTELLERVWNLTFDPGSNVVDTHLARLRSKLGRAGARDLIVTIRGEGFQLAGEAVADRKEA